MVEYQPKDSQAYEYFRRISRWRRKYCRSPDGRVTRRTVQEYFGIWDGNRHLCDLELERRILSEQGRFANFKKKEKKRKEEKRKEKEKQAKRKREEKARQGILPF